MPTEKPAIFITSGITIQAITKPIYDYLLAQGFDVVYHFAEDIQVDYTTVVEAQILARAVFITVFSTFNRTSSTHHFQQMVDTAIEHERIIIPLMVFEDSWDSEYIQTRLSDTWQALTHFEPLHLNFGDFNVTLNAISDRLASIDTSAVKLHATSETLALTPFDYEDVESALKAQEVYEQGNRYFYDRDYEEVISYLDKAIELNPKFGSAYNTRALAYLSLHEYHEALMDIQKAIDLNPQIATLHANQAAIYYESLEYNRYYAAMKAINKALELDEKFAYAYRIRGDIHSAQHDWVAAIDDYTKCLEYVTDDSNLYNLRAITYEYLNNDEAALADYTRALEMKENPIFYHNRATVYGRLGLLEKGIADLDAAIELDPSSTRAILSRAVAKMTIHQHDAALRDVNTVIELDPELADAYVTRGTIYASSEENELALQDFNKAIDLDSSSASAYESRASIIAKMGDPKRALQDAHRAIALEPEQSIGYIRRATIYESLGDFASALIDYNKAIELEPSSAHYSFRGLLLISMAQYSDARKDFEMVLTLDPNNKKVLEFLEMTDGKPNEPAEPDGCWGIFASLWIF